jgi:hypothetical protein
MSMTPQERQEFEILKRKVESLERVENIPFIENIKRRVAVTGITSGAITAATSITESVRNSADTGSETVAKDYDGKLQVTLSDGTVKYIGIYNS